MPEPEPTPERAPSPAPKRAARWGGRVDALTAGLVLAFALVAGSFAARNPDLWMHLAAGRLLAGGDYRFGTDPFAFTTADRYWANHSWLFDLGLYLAYGRLGGAGLVALKALAVAATAGAMLYAARGRGPAWVAAGCMLLALLAMSPRLLLQPTVASLLLLAVCLCCLRAGGRALLAVPVLIALWVNVDAWFVLGPALVCLFWVGRRIDPGRAALPAWPGWLVPASLAACLLSPHHVFALQLPLELSPAVWGSEFRSDARFAGVFASPWRWGPLGASGGYSLAAWAFFVLLGLGVLSFALNRRAVRSWRAAVWLPFALLAVWQARLIPLFAVVAGPVVALNLRELVPESAFARPGRALVLAASVALVGLGWLGWVNGFSNRDRGAAWEVHADPTLARAAVGVAAWRQANSVPPDERVFATHPDLGHYLAWFAPGERCFLDSRLQLFTHVSGDFAALSRALGLLPDGDIPLDELLRAHGIAAVVLHDPEPGRMTRGLRASAGEAGRWEVARIDGAAVLLVPKGGPRAGTHFRPEHEAFGGAGGLPVAYEGPSALAEPVQWWEVTRSRGRTGSWEADAATVHLRLFEGGSSNSPALPLLAVRGARVGVEADPADANAWLALARAYLLLGSRTWERDAGAGFTLLEHVRFVQATAALVQGALLNPDAVPPRETLARLFLARNTLDLAHRHAADALRLARRAGPLAGETPEAFDARVARLAALVESLEPAVLDAENRFLIHTAGLGGDPLARARVAAGLGLTQKAIDVLVSSHPDLYGAAGLGLLADLLLRTGQASECRVLLDRAELRRNPDSLGVYTLPRKPNPDGRPGAYQFHAYDWFDLCQCAAVGRYSGASAAIDRLRERLAADERAMTPVLSRGATAFVAGEVGSALPPAPVLARLPDALKRVQLNELLANARTLSVTRADLTTLAAVLDLERGDAPAAALRFDAALGLFNAAKGSPLSLPGEPLAARYHEAIQPR